MSDIDSGTNSGLQTKIHSELLGLRKLSNGLTVASLGSCPVLCAVLGEGDPYVTYNAIKHQLLAVDADTALQAAMYSLGLASAGTSHLARLEDFGAEYGYDQRHARRYSDRGIQQLSRLLATNWSGSPAPELEVTLFQTVDADFDCFITTRRPRYIEMRPVRAVLRDADAQLLEVELTLRESTSGPWAVGRLSIPVVVPVSGEVSLSISWQGEQWPKFAVRMVEGFSDCTLSFESLGNKLMITTSRHI